MQGNSSVQRKRVPKTKAGSTRLEKKLKNKDLEAGNTGTGLGGSQDLGQTVG